MECFVVDGSDRMVIRITMRRRSRMGLYAFSFPIQPLGTWIWLDSCQSHALLRHAHRSRPRLPHQSAFSVLFYSELLEHCARDLLAPAKRGPLALHSLGLPHSCLPN